MADPDGIVERLEQVPFVNGGLFDCLDDFAAADALQADSTLMSFTDNIATQVARDLEVPARLFFDREHGLFPLFRHYKFTVEENTPLDCEVALDPELLGRVFENLLAAYNPETKESARKATGSYYTPRQVVDYMVAEALVEALAGNAQPTIQDDEFWYVNGCVICSIGRSLRPMPATSLKREREGIPRAGHMLVSGFWILRSGSGAFPMGVLH